MKKTDENLLKRRYRWSIRLIIYSIIGPFTLASLYIGFLALSVVIAGYSWDEMDWNSDGQTSFEEFLETTDIDKRPTVKDGHKCVEFYRLKDGLPVRVDCSESFEKIDYTVIYKHSE